MFDKNSYNYTYYYNDNVYKTYKSIYDILAVTAAPHSLPLTSSMHAKL